jgi:hypothetical protein
MYASAMIGTGDAERLNASCFCVTTDARRVHADLHTGADPERWAHLVSSAPVFVSRRAIAAMEEIVGAIERTLGLPLIREGVLADAPPVARLDHGPAGAMMGYDFHIVGDTPRLIEINTNAGGAAINARVIDAQEACCVEIGEHLIRARADVPASVVKMFRSEWRLQRGDAPLKSIAIVDDRPAEQYLFPEFVAIQTMLDQAGISTFIADPRDLRLVDNRLLLGEAPIDLVYNRLTDFMLEAPEHAALYIAHATGGAVVTPAPRHHALYANKKNLALLTDDDLLARAGVSEKDRTILHSIPRTVAVTESAADSLWSRRKDLFFKPADGYGSKAVYRGDKLTRTVWDSILAGDYVAQDVAPAARRTVRVGDAVTELKTDLRLYTYRGAPLLAAARVYQGQTTNFRTPGGGFAAVYMV